MDEIAASDPLAAQAAALIDPHEPLVTGLANVAALLGSELADLNWVGFYLRGEAQDTLWLGPFAGRAACTRIAVGSGVCGTAVAEDRTVVVEDVQTFAGHIACDPASRSETVVPLRTHDGAIVGVLDADSPRVARFDPIVVTTLEAVAAVVGRACSAAAVKALVGAR